MKLSVKILAVAFIAATVSSLTGCAGPAGFSYKNVGITLSASCSDCPLGILYNPAFPVPAVSTQLGYGEGGIAPAGSVEYMDNQGEGGEYWFTANVTNAAPNITWNVYPTTDLFDIITLPAGTSIPIGESTGGLGTFVASGNTADYSQNSISSGGAASSSSVPIYTGTALQQALAMNIPQGDVLITASVPADPSNPSVVVTASQMLQMYAQGGNPTIRMTPCTPGSTASCPSTTAGSVSGITSSAAFVPRGTSFQFTGFAVGASPCNTTATCNAIYAGAPLNTSDNTVTWSVGNATQGSGAATIGGLVNGVAGPYGTITQSGLYTAPAVIPITGYQPIVVMASHAAPTVTALAYITVQ